MKIGSRKSHDSLGGGGVPLGFRGNPRSTIPMLALEYGGGKKEEWKMESLY